MVKRIDVTKIQRQMASRNLFCVGWGLVHHIICAPHDMLKDELEATANRLYPTGISSQWKLADPVPKEGIFKGTNALPCPDCATRLHYLLEC